MNLAKYKKVERELNALSSDAGYMQKLQHPSFYLERVRLLLAKLENPEQKFRYVHVGGTAGKGSVTIMLHTILHKARYRVGSYLSPHVTTLAERFMINGHIASPSDVVWAWGKMKKIIVAMTREYGSRYTPSYFEAAFALSLLIFAKHRVNVVVLEVGCGGEYDATNAIPSPVVAILTNVHLDHTELLGRTRKAIARTKAGIIKPGSLVLTGEPDPVIRKILSNRARHHHDAFQYIPASTKHAYDLTLYGEYQQHNASIAAAAARHLGINQTAIRNGLHHARIPARMEIMQYSPIVVIDGAHNPIKLAALKKALTTIPHNRLHAIIGMGKNKPIRQMLQMLLPICQTIAVTQAHMHHPAPIRATHLLRQARKMTQKPLRSFASVRRAVEYTMRIAQKNDLILITGSLYLAGEARTYWISEQQICSTHNLFPS